MIEVYQCNACSDWHLTVNGSAIASSSSQGVLRRIARIFEHCRNTSYRAAIKTLIDDIGFDEDEAIAIYPSLVEYRQTNTVQ